MNINWKLKIKKHQRLGEGFRLVKWIILFWRRPFLAVFTIYYLLCLKKCGLPVEFSKTMIIRNPENIKIGFGCSFSNFVILDGHDQITIGNNCMFANNVIISTATHDYGIDPMNKTMIKKPTIIQDNVWIGIGAVVLPGVTIGEGSVIGAMSLVNTDVPPRAIVVGRPARIIKFR